jgi:uncharacterized protein YkwD
VRRAALVVALLLASLVASACNPEEIDATIQVNHYREVNGRSPLAWDEDAYAKAAAWSEHMADEGHLSHSKLAEGAPPGWRRLGENVAVAGGLDQALRALEASPGHRANLLNEDFTRIAIGVHQRDGRVWVTEFFIG